jgi:putative transposase
MRAVIQWMNYPLDVMLVCVRWYAVYPPSFRNIEEMMAERGVFVDHSTLHRWSMKMLPDWRWYFIGESWRMDETYVKISGRWKYLFQAVERDGNTVDFLLRARRDRTAARAFVGRAIDLNDAPERITIFAMIRPTAVQSQTLPFRLTPRWKYASRSGSHHAG